MAHTPLFSRLRRLATQAIPLSRRGLARASAAVVGGQALAACSGDRGGEGDGGRVVIVGGGLAGIHCAYRLGEAGIDVVVHEAQNRIGGRTFSSSEGAPAQMLVELGGEFIDSNHATLWALAEELELTLDDRFSLAPTGEIFWIAGAAVDEATILSQWMAIAPAMAAMVEAADTDDAAYEQYDNQTLRAWLDENVPIADYPELHTILDVAYRGEFGLESDEQSALNLLYLMDPGTLDEFHIFGESDERWHCHGGNQQFVDRMAEALGDDQLVLGSRLIAARDSDAGNYVLTFEDQDGNTTEVVAEHVVFALPFSVLRECDLSGLTLSDQKRQIIEELGYGTNTKVMGSFSTPVWRDDFGASGAATSDLPFQQSWDSSIGQAGPEGILTNFLGGQAGVDAGDGTAEDWYTAQLLPGIEQIFPGTTAAYVAGSAVRMHWPSVPTHKGSYTCYRPGQWATWALEGVREGNLHFCGEHCSPDFQGWMEGAAETGGLVAMEIIDDLGGTASARHLALVQWVTELVPHPCYHGDLAPRLRWTSRRWLLQQRFARPRPYSRRRRVSSVFGPLVVVDFFHGHARARGRGLELA
jgi:monoamine oxidase